VEKILFSRLGASTVETVSSMIVWVSGLSGAGKTTLCEGIYRRIKPLVPEVVLLDGDSVRSAFGSDLSHSEADRRRQIKRIQGMTKVLVEQGLIVIIAVVYSHPDVQKWNRENLPNYFEIYLKASLDTVMGRDEKGLYALAKEGKMPDLVGVDIPWHPPEASDLVLSADDGTPPEVLQQRVIDALPLSLRARIAAE